MITSIWKGLINSFEKKYSYGDAIDHYVVVKELGKGSYGTSYLVRDRNTKQRYVLKRLRPYKRFFNNGQNFIEYEASILRNISHSSFPSVFSQGVEGKSPYFVMEYKEGKTFETLVFKDKMCFDEKSSAQIVLKLIKLVGFIHENGYVHRDLRLPNIIWNQEELSIIDFGLCTRIQSTSHIEVHKQKDYMRERAVTSDFYALGHFYLFLLYSCYHDFDLKEKSWEEELDISSRTRQVLRKLLGIEEPYKDYKEIITDLSR
ncbi:serine/threonine-protein kinase [Bacillus pakistanensis]|uniref:Serine/threonine-protein kinase n=1 Tax=Rossellomorea pakistanensis TaxID=992288 RepID=A0ABS2N8N6_9BACI|nr:protein kinase [Bacillus pakistanensis]MBM7584226.1 serine/threonine-protein kinase [Bacillus pakistanensis]